MVKVRKSGVSGREKMLRSAAIRRGGRFEKSKFSLHSGPQTLIQRTYFGSSKNIAVSRSANVLSLDRPMYSHRSIQKHRRIEVSKSGVCGPEMFKVLGDPVWCADVKS